MVRDRRGDGRLIYLDGLTVVIEAVAAAVPSSSDPASLQARATLAQMGDIPPGPHRHELLGRGVACPPLSEMLAPAHAKCMNWRGEWRIHPGPTPTAVSFGHCVMGFVEQGKLSQSDGATGDGLQSRDGSAVDRASEPDYRHWARRLHRFER